MKKKDPKFEKWKKEVMKDVLRTVITDRVKFSEYLEQVLDLAYMHGFETGMTESFEAIGKKLRKLNFPEK